MMGTEYVLELSGICKSFPGVKALDGVNLKIEKGKVHALMGENGAGKSTLMKIIDGIYQPDAGTIRMYGQQIKIHGPRDAIAKGISMIHQELNPVPHMTIAENIFLGREMKKSLGFVDRDRMLKETEKLLKRLDFDFDPSQKIGELSVAGMQMIEIAKAVSCDAKVILMDEPTSAITENEVEKLFTIIRELISHDVAIVYITHKMDEVFQIADQVTVIRDGQYIDSKPVNAFTPDALVTMLVGRKLDQIYPKESVPIGDTLLEVRHLSRHGEYKDISFTVRRGEILGVAGLVGAGRTELFESIAGITRPDSGEIYLSGKPVQFRSPEDAIRHKIVIATEDRKGSGLFLQLPIRENVLMESYRDKFPSGFVSKRLMNQIGDDQLHKFSIKASGIRQLVGTLSGGNQQKVVLSKVLLTEPEIIIFDEPTRGIDVGAKSEIYKIMVQLAREGKCIVMISSELPEILGMSDRVMVMCQGDMTGILDRGPEMTQEKIFSMACGQQQ